jgi:hypothetical protein
MAGRLISTVPSEIAKKNRRVKISGGSFDILKSML